LDAALDAAAHAALDAEVLWAWCLDLRRGWSPPRATGQACERTEDIRANALDPPRIQNS
jgi:hypothetical protein